MKFLSKRKYVRRHEARQSRRKDDFLSLEILEDRLMLATIGSDAFGYEAVEHPFDNTIDLVRNAVDVFEITDGENEAGSVDLGGNSFNFYGTSYTGNNRLFVSTNGLISFGSSNTEAVNGDLTSSPNQRTIAPLWDNWRFDLGTINTAVFGKFEDTSGDGTTDRLIVEWSQGELRSDTGDDPSDATFQAILTLNTGAVPGPIVFNYPDLDVGTGTITATVGVKESGNQGGKRLLIANGDSPFVEDDKAIRIFKPGVIVKPATDLVTTEGGSTAKFTLVLSSIPTANVTVPLRSSDTTEGVLNRQFVTFTPANALTPRTVTVSGVDDKLKQAVDGNVRYKIITAPTTSNDPKYRGLNPEDVAVTNIDNEPLTVTSTNDIDNGVCNANHCSLREAINALNPYEDHFTIKFAASVKGTINLTGPLPVLATNIAIKGPGADSLKVKRRSGGNYRIFTVAKGIDVNISGLTISSGSDAQGGGIYNAGKLTITDSTISGNQAIGMNGSSPTSGDGRDGGDGRGGGIFNVGSLTLDRCLIYDNQAIGGNGGGGANTSATRGDGGAGGDGLGGGIFQFGGVLQVLNSTFSTNEAYGGVGGNGGNGGDSRPSGNGGPGGAGAGGGINVAGAGSAISIRSSTIAHNSIRGGDGGVRGFGSIPGSDGADGMARGGGVRVQGGKVRVANSLIALNASMSQADFSGVVTSNGYNLIGDATGSNGFKLAKGDLLGGNGKPVIDSRIGPLRKNGGPTRTHALMLDSPARNAGDPDFVAPPDNDQRGTGFERVAHGRIDIGAYEFQAVSISGKTADVYGTDGKDQFTFVAGKPHIVKVNGHSYKILSSIERIRVHGGKGKDSIRVTGTSGNETATLRPGSADVVGPKYHLIGDSLESVLVIGQGGTDKSYLYDSAGNDKFYGRPSYSYMTGTGFYSRVNGFDKVFAYATSGDAGGVSDRAFVYDSSGKDTFLGRNDHGRLTGNGFLIFAKGFGRLNAYANAGGIDRIDNRSLSYAFFKYGSWEHIL